MDTGVCIGSIRRTGMTLPPLVERRSHGRGLNGSASNLSKAANVGMSLSKSASRRLECETIEDNRSSGRSSLTSRTIGGRSSSLRAHRTSASTEESPKPRKSSIPMASSSSVNSDSPQSRRKRRQVESSVRTLRVALTRSRRACTRLRLSASDRRGCARSIQKSSADNG